IRAIAACARSPFAAPPSASAGAPRERRLWRRDAFPRGPDRGAPSPDRGWDREFAQNQPGRKLLFRDRATPASRFRPASLRILPGSGDAPPWNSPIYWGTKASAYTFLDVTRPKKFLPRRIKRQSAFI